MQRSTVVNAQDLCGFLELLLIGLVIIHIFIFVVIFILVGRGEVYLLAAAWPCRGVLPGRGVSCRVH